MIINERETRKEYMLEAAKQIMLAARTAPKGKGVDIIEIITLSDEDIDAVSEELLGSPKNRHEVPYPGQRKHTKRRRHDCHRNTSGSARS